MKTNPYQTPSSNPTATPESTGDRALATQGFRLSTVLLTCPALYNFFCFSSLGSPTSAIHAFTWLHVAMTLAILFAAAVLSTLGFTALEFATRVLHAVFAKRSGLNSWKQALYSSLQTLPLFASFGAVAWALWVLAFYQLQASFYTASVPLGIIGHLLAAGVYGPLFFKWYQIEYSAPHHPTT
jgi:hypothetical protein